MSTACQRYLKSALAERRTVRVAEIELGDIAMQMVFAAMLVNAFHAALENRVVALDRVRIDLHAGLAFGIAIFAALKSSPR